MNASTACRQSWSIISTAAGMVVTRSSSSLNLGQALTMQLFRQPRAIYLAAGSLAVFGLIPGLPTLPFLALAAVFVEGILFLLLAVSGVRAALLRAIPTSIKIATMSGIGLFLDGPESRATVRGRYLLYYNGPFVRELPGASLHAREAHERRVMGGIEEYLRTAGFASV